MKNLEKLSLVELDAQEMQQTEGGFLPLVAIVAIWGVQTALVAAGIGALATVASASRE